MKDATSALREKYFNLLSTISYDNSTFPVYADELNDTYSPYTRQDPPKAYFVMSNQNTVLTDNNKCGFNGNYSIQIDVFTIYPAYNGSSLFSEQIAQEVLDAVMPNVQFDIQPNNFYCYKTTYNSFALKESTAVQNIFRRILIFNHSIKEN